MVIEQAGRVFGLVRMNYMSARIKTRISGRFEGLLKEASTLKTSVSFYGIMIHNAGECPG